MTKIIVNNKQRQIVFKSYEECHQVLGVPLKTIRTCIDTGNYMHDKHGNLWTVDVLEE